MGYNTISKISRASTRNGTSRVSRQLYFLKTLMTAKMPKYHWEVVIKGRWKQTSWDYVIESKTFPINSIATTDIYEKGIRVSFSESKISIHMK